MSQLYEQFRQPDGFLYIRQPPSRSASSGARAPARGMRRWSTGIEGRGTGPRAGQGKLAKGLEGALDDVRFGFRLGVFMREQKTFDKRPFDFTTINQPSKIW